MNKLVLTVAAEGSDAAMDCAVRLPLRLAALFGVDCSCFAAAAAAAAAVAESVAFFAALDSLESFPLVLTLPVLRFPFPLALGFAFAFSCGSLCSFWWTLFSL